MSKIKDQDFYPSFSIPDLYNKGEKDQSREYENLSTSIPQEIYELFKP